MRLTKNSLFFFTLTKKEEEERIEFSKTRCQHVETLVVQLFNRHPVLRAEITRIP